MANKRHRIAFDPEDPSIRKILTVLSDELGIPPGDVLNYGAVVALTQILEQNPEVIKRLKSSLLLRYNKRLEISDLIKELKRLYGDKFE